MSKIRVFVGGAMLALAFLVVAPAITGLADGPTGPRPGAADDTPAPPPTTVDITWI